MEKIVEEVSRMLVGRVIVSKEEIERKAIRAALRVLGVDLKDFSPKEISEVVCSFIDCPISIKSLHFSEKIEIDGAEFYHLHTRSPTKKDFELAFEEYLKSKAFLDVLEDMKIAANNIFNFNGKGDYLRFYENYNYTVFFSTISDVFEDVKTHISLAEKIPNYVVLVKTEEKPDEFVKFFHHYSEDFKRANAKIWVVNVKNKSIDPFIGFPREAEIMKRFRNPKFTSLINSLWRKKVEDLD